MNPFVFQLFGVLPADRYLPGHVRWNYPVRLTSVLVQGRGPVTGTLRLQLEIGGALQGLEVALPVGGEQMVERTVTVAVLVPADTEVRWRAAYDGAPEDAALGISLTLHAVPQSISQVAVRRARLTLRWINAREHLTLFDYDAESHAFTETTAGLATGRVTLTQNGTTNFNVAFQAVERLRVAGGIVYAPEFFALGGIATLFNPRVLFCVNELAVAVLTAGGLRVVELTEAAPTVLTPADAGFYDRFEFYSGGALTATLNDRGLVAGEIREPIP